MSEVASAIVKVLDAHGGWITPGTLRDRLPAGCPRGEPLELALGQLINTKRVEMRPAGDQVIYRLVPGSDSSAPAPVPIATPGPGRAVADAFHPPPRPVLLRGQPLGDTDEIRPPAPKNVSHAKRKEISTMTSNEDSPKAKILKMLEAGPLRTIEIAKKLDVTDAGAAFHLRALEKERKISKASRLSPWSLLNGKGTGEPAAPASSSPGRAATTHKRKSRKAPKATAKRAARHNAPRARPAGAAAGNGCLQDVELKSRLLEQLASTHPNRIEQFVLREIREDLQRLAA